MRRRGDKFRPTEGVAPEDRGPNFVFPRCLLFVYPPGIRARNDTFNAQYTISSVCKPGQSFDFLIEDHKLLV